MGIDLYAAALLFRAHNISPNERVTNKEALFWRKAVDRRVRLSFERFLQRRIRHFQSSKVGDVLALGEFSIQMQSVDDGVFRKLFHDSSRARFEFFRALR